MTKFRERMQATGRSMRMLAEVAGVSSSLVCYIAQGYAHFPEYEQLCRVCYFMGCKPTDLHKKDELRRWYGVGEPRRKSKEGSPRVRIDKPLYEFLAAHSSGTTPGKLINWLLLQHVNNVKDFEEAERDTTGT
jgi:DNA-binding Xre family transcriptional regulator